MVNKNQLVNEIAKRSQCSRTQAMQVVNVFLDVMSNALKKGDAIRMINFGTFSVTERASRRGRNPATGKEMVIPKGKVVRFRPGKVLKEMVRSSK